MRSNEKGYPSYEDLGAALSGSADGLVSSRNAEVAARYEREIAGMTRASSAQLQAISSGNLPTMGGVKGGARQAASKRTTGVSSHLYGLYGAAALPEDLGKTIEQRAFVGGLESGFSNVLSSGALPTMGTILAARSQVGGEELFDVTYSGDAHDVFARGALSVESDSDEYLGYGDDPRKSPPSVGGRGFDEYLDFSLPEDLSSPAQVTLDLAKTEESPAFADGEPDRILASGEQLAALQKAWSRSGSVGAFEREAPSSGSSSGSLTLPYGVEPLTPEEADAVLDALDSDGKSEN